MKPKQPAEVEKGSMYVRIKHSHPSHVHVTVAKVVREGNSVRHHHVASIGKVKHSGRHPDGTYKFALGAREMLCGSRTSAQASTSTMRRPLSSGMRSPRKSNRRRPTRGNRPCRANREAVAVQQNLCRPADDARQHAQPRKRNSPRSSKEGRGRGPFGEQVSYQQEVSNSPGIEFTYTKR
jgi:hypothetical protein